MENGTGVKGLWGEEQKQKPSNSSSGEREGGGGERKSEDQVSSRWKQRFFGVTIISWGGKNRRFALGNGSVPSGISGNRGSSEVNEKMKCDLAEDNSKDTL